VSCFLSAAAVDAIAPSRLLFPTPVVQGAAAGAVGDTRREALAKKQISFAFSFH
jgi:hypothetical protein